MQKIAVEGLTIYELCLFWNDYLVFADAIIGIVPMNGLYGTYIEVFLYHGIQSREINHTFCGSQTLPNGFILELLIHLWTCFFEIGLVEIEDVINL